MNASLSNLDLLADGDFDVTRCRGCRRKCIIRPLRIFDDHPAGLAVVTVTRTVVSMTPRDLLHAWAIRRLRGED